MKILGISAFYHDSAAALIDDGRIVSAAQEERFTRKKHDASYPHHAIRYCLDEAGLELNAVDHVVFYEKPFLKFERLLETYLAFAPRGFRSFSKSMPVWFQEKLFQKNALVKELRKQAPGFDCKRLLFSEHHLSHAASAFFPSPFEKAAILTLDGAGEWTTTSLGMGDGNHLEIVRDISFPHSLGLLYSAFTYHLGFKVNSGEYKVMGLAPYGTPKHLSTALTHLIDLKQDGSFRLNLEYFDYCTGLKMTNRKFSDLFGLPPRKPEEALTQAHMDLAATVQAVTETAVLRLARSIAKETGCRHLCLAGGVALNCVANGKIQREGIFDSLWIQPAAGDAGGALGAALVAYYLHRNQARVPSNGKDAMAGSYLGPAFAPEIAKKRLSQSGAHFRQLGDAEIIEACADLLAEGKALGWFQSRMEFGPRALGGRSILADPRSISMQSTLNLKIKYRESFRPFAPIILREDLEEWFELATDSPYMLLVTCVQAAKRKLLTAEQDNLFGIAKLHIARSQIPAVTHVDYSARVQTVHRETHPKLHALLRAFKKRTGCPVLVNTSFNVRAEPIVCTPEDALRCFMGTELDALAVENSLLLKQNQNPALKRNYQHQFTLD